MEGIRFDHLARSLVAHSRRGLLAGLAGGLSHAAFGLPTAEAKKRKKRKPKIVFNQYGCVDVGKECGGNSANCCSGICQSVKGKKKKGKRRKKKSVCVSHNVDNCPVGGYSCEGDLGALCADLSGHCVKTTGNGPFCAGSSWACSSCTKDTDCQAQFGPGAACADCFEQCGSTQGRACLAAAI